MDINLEGFRVLLPLEEGTCLVLIRKRKVLFEEVWYRVKIANKQAFLRHTLLLPLVEAMSTAIDSQVTALQLPTITQCDFEGSTSHYVAATNPKKPANGEYSCRCDIVSLDVDGNLIVIHKPIHQIYEPGKVDLVQNVNNFGHFFVIPLDDGFNNIKVEVEKGETGIIVNSTARLEERRTRNVSEDDIAEFIRLNGPGSSEAAKDEDYYKARAADLPSYVGVLPSYVGSAMRKDEAGGFLRSDDEKGAGSSARPFKMPPPEQDDPSFAISATIDWLNGSGQKCKDVLFPNMPTEELAELVQKTCGCLDGITTRTMEKTLFNLHFDLHFELHLKKTEACVDICIRVVSNCIKRGSLKPDHVDTLRSALKKARSEVDQKVDESLC